MVVVLALLVVRWRISLHLSLGLAFRPSWRRCGTPSGPEVAYYIDTSALVKLVVAEAETDAFRSWLAQGERGRLLAISFKGSGVDIWLTIAIFPLIQNPRCKNGHNRSICPCLDIWRSKGKDPTTRPISRPRFRLKDWRRRKA